MKKFIKLSLLILSVSIAAQLLLGTTVSAQLLNNSSELESMTKTTKDAANLGDITIGQMAAQIIQVALGFLAIIFLILIIFAGFRWMTASGNEEQVKKATKTITAAVIGLVVVLAAYTITYFIFNQLPFTGGGSIQVGTGG
jgi:amino acid transporter